MRSAVHALVGRHGELTVSTDGVAVVVSSSTRTERIAIGHLDGLGDGFRAIRPIAAAACVVEPGIRLEELESLMVAKAVEDLDPHSHLLGREQAARWRNLIDGTDDSCGFTAQLISGGFRIESIVPGSTAEAAGLRTGDTVDRVDDTSVIGRDPDLLAKALGMSRAHVRIHAQRAGIPGGLETDLARGHGAATTFEVIDDPQVCWMRLDEFDARATDRVRDALMLHPSQPVILDLRDNGGGLLSQALALASFFVADGADLARSVGRNGREVIYTNTSAPICTGPLVILTSARTASAAELFTACMVQHDRAVLVGESTYGKGTMQRTFDLPDGSALEITTDAMIAPDGSRFQECGVVPDIRLTARSGSPHDRLAPDAPIRERDLPGHGATTHEAPRPEPFVVMLDGSDPVQDIDANASLVSAAMHHLIDAGKLTHQLPAHELRSLLTAACESCHHSLTVARLGRSDR